MAERCVAALCVHGAGAGGWEWAIWRAVFEGAGIAVAAPDLMPPAEGVAHATFDAYAAQVRNALIALPRPRALVGASLGGLLALRCADAADALVLVNPLPTAPWHAHLPARTWPDVVAWGHDARLHGTRRALPDADDATALFAFRHWRDESGAVLRDAYAGMAVPRPAVPVLCVVSMHDEDVQPRAVLAMAQAWDADVLRLPGASHAGALLGREAAGCARRVADWLSAG